MHRYTRPDMSAGAGIPLSSKEKVYFPMDKGIVGLRKPYEP